MPQKPYFEEFAEKNIGKVSHGISLSRVAYDSIQNEWVPNHPQFGALVAEKRKMPTPVVQPKPELVEKPNRSTVVTELDDYSDQEIVR